MLHVGGERPAFLDAANARREESDRWGSRHVRRPAVLGGATMPHAPRNARAWFAVLAMAGACVLGGCGSSTPPDAPATGALVRDGAARFPVLSPTLLRLAYPADARLDDRATQTAIGRTAGRQ